METPTVLEAVLETNGQISVLPKSQNQPVTPQDLKMDTRYKGMPQVLVVDGNIAQHRLSELGLSDLWLKQELNNLGIKDISEVMIAQLDTTGKLYIDKRQTGKGVNYSL